MYKVFHQGKNLILNDLPKGENMTIFSLLNDLSQPLDFRSFSIKYVFEGREDYNVNGNKYRVEKGEYLLANSYSNGRVNIDSRNLVKGLCIDISPSVLSEAFSGIVAPDSPVSDISLDTFFNSEAFLENKYHEDGTMLGQRLASLGQQMDKDPYYNYELSKEFYFSLVEAIVHDHNPVIAQLYNIKTVKHCARKDLYRRLCRGKEFLEHGISNKISIADAAEHAMLSEYHFFRLFKTTFGITPQQYLIKVRLARAIELLRTGNFSITDVSIVTGFSDVSGFSKSFKKYFGISPSKFYGQ